MIIKYILPILGLSLVILVHEIGHLLVGKFFGIKAEVFSIGIGKKILHFTKNGTQYAISLIPLGGYCRFKGGDIQNPSNDKDSMDVLSPIKKVAIYAAGPIFNFLLTILLLSTNYMLPINQNILPQILPVTGQNLPAEISGLQKADIIISINNNIINDFQDISDNLNNEILEFVVQRDNKQIVLSITPQNIDGRSFIGVYPYIPLKILNSKSSLLLIDDIITKIDDENVDNYLSLLKLIDNRNDFNLTINRGGNNLKFKYNLKDLNNISFTNTYSHNPFTSFILGFEESVSMFKKITNLFINLFKSGDVSKSISSPLRLVYDMGNSMATIYSISSIVITIQTLLLIISSISLTLGFVNLLPIPVLDGGQILINTISAIKRKPLNTKLIIGYQTVGLVIVLLLFTLGIGNDIFYFGDL